MRQDCSTFTLKTKKNSYDEITIFGSIRGIAVHFLQYGN